MFKHKIDNQISLRLVEEGFAEELTDVVSSNYKHLRPFLDWVKKDYSLADAREFVRLSRLAFAKNEGITFCIFEDGKVVGAIGFVAFNWSNKRTEIGYWLAKKHQGKGIITKCCKALIQYAFEDLKMHRIEIHCAIENVRSRAIPEKLGFKLDGTLRESEWRHKRYFDMAIYSLLAREWRELQK